jgi:hypothetical protein
LLDIARVGIHLITDKGRMLRISRFYGYSGGYLILDPYLSFGWDDRVSTQT